MTDRAAHDRTAAGFERQDAPSLQCPNCHGRGLSHFYSVDGIPVHSCLLMPTREKATGYPKGDLRLGFCKTCGFIANTRFDPSVHEYSQLYEETQGFSPTFNAFAKSLAQRLIDEYDLRGKTILEIGCGKGEFLELICTLGDNRGIGIDPAHVPGRSSTEAASRVEFIEDFYSEKYAHLKADMVCCRHTLEHIAPTLDFMRMVRRAVGDAPDTLVFFEVPDVLRVLREGAFWDIYYEHCSYLSLGSLARVFRASGFEVTDLELAYDDQYSLIMARPTDAPSPPGTGAEDDMPALVEAVERFTEVCSRRIDEWRRTISRIASTGGRTVVWGSGSKGVAFLTTLDVTDEIDVAVDINTYKHGKFMPGTGQEIVSPESLVDLAPTHVIVMNPIYCEEIQADLDRLGVEAELLPVV